MDCRILRHVTLKSNGHLGCDDSVGYGIDLGHVSLSPGWSIRNVLRGPVYEHVRSSFRAGRVPWPNLCEGCDLFSGGGSPTDTLDTRLELLVEPTLACSLACACCLRKQIIGHGRKIESMNPKILARFVESCRAEKIAIDQVHYIGWGEPLMHDCFRGLFDIVKAGASLAQQVVTTAANVDFRTTVGDCALDRVVASVDGSRQRPYETYRQGGDLSKAIRFMRDSKRFGSKTIFLEWKYILFEFNDSNEDIFLAQEIADDIGVDSLLFIITNSKWHSQRFTVDHCEDLPIQSIRASVSPAAAMNVVALDGRIDFTSRTPLAYIDRCNISVGQFLTVEGWALDRSGAYAAAVELILDGQTRAQTRTNLRRADVLAAYPNVAGATCGFMFRIPCGAEKKPERVEIRVLGQSGPRLIGGGATWISIAPGIKRRADLLRTLP